MGTDAPVGPDTTPTLHALAGKVTLPPQLPISDRADEVVQAIRDHQVVVVAGETGSGKSTQLPKLALLAGRGNAGLIGHTQPRRLAARAVGSRIAEELGVQFGQEVGYQVRFTDTTSKKTAVKLMTDGILLNELQRDRRLSRYDTLIIDEAHERGLNIDVILGYLAQLLPRRPDLKVIVTSATIDTQRFAEHFADAEGTPAPVIDVAGRTYPVDIRYRPRETDDGDDLDLPDAIVHAVDELCDEGPGDILVFASGEADIRAAADALTKAGRHHRNLRGVDVLPLFARLSAAEQQRVFAPHKGRRVVIATNIAETSLTVPGIRYVVDPGLARISRYGRKSKVQRLPIEKISQASANQRSGRCGRLGPGIAIRLFEEEDFAARPEFTEPEILRTNLASVVLRMIDLGLGDIDAFPFVEAPERSQVKDGVELLEELSAVMPAPDAPGGRALTDVGRQLARIPLDPRIGRMVLAGADQGCAHEVAVIAAFLSVQDPRERPRENPGTADAMHDRFLHPGSDFVTVLNMWDHLQTQKRRLSSSQFRRTCKQEFLHHLRVREWIDTHRQVVRVLDDLKIPVSRAVDPADDVSDAAAAQVHRAMLTGLLGNIGARDGESREYAGTRGTRFVIGRRSALSESPPAWIMVAELVETNRLWASTGAAIRPSWIEPLLGDLAKIHHGESRWDPSRGTAVVTERVTFRGLPIVQGRLVNLDRSDVAAARAMFIEHALVRGELVDEIPAAARNADRLAEVEQLESRLRRRLLLPEDVLFDFYEQRIPADVTSLTTFTGWWRGAVRERPQLLTLDVQTILSELDAPPGSDYPDQVPTPIGGLPVSYTFDPSAPEADGLTIDIPVEALGAVDQGQLEWLVPGLREELLIAMVRALPKAKRRALVPVPDTARAVSGLISPADGPLRPVLARELTRRGGVPVFATDFDLTALPGHLRPRFRVVDGTVPLAAGEDLSALRDGVAAHVRTVARTADATPAQTGLTTFPPEPLPTEVTVTRSGLTMTSHPALVDEGKTVGVRSFGSRAEADAAMAAGTRRLLRLDLPNPVRTVDRQLDAGVKMALTLAPHAGVGAVMEDCLGCVIDAIVADHGGPARDADAFEALRRTVRADSPRLLVPVAKVTADAARRARSVREALSRPTPAELTPVKTDVARHLGRLVYPGFVTATGAAQVGHVPRYLEGMRLRLEAAGRNPGAEAANRELIADLEDEHRLLTELRPGASTSLRAIRWQLEELRISLFAQSLKTAGKISEARIRRALADVRKGVR